MSESWHTEGSATTAHMVNHGFLVLDADNKMVATAYLNERGVNGAWERAQLIAAAPDMLAALIAIRDWLLLKEKVAESGDFWRKDFAKANNLTNYAIAKAKGAKP